MNVGVLVTLQGATPQEHDLQTKSPGSWDRTLAGLKCFKEEGVEVSINMTVTRKNFRLIKGVAKLVEELGLTQSNLKELSTIIRSTDLSTLKNVKSLMPIPACSEITSKISSGICRAGLTRCCITPDLGVKACMFSDKMIGNLENNTLEKIWFSKEMRKWRSLGSYPNECLNCAAFGNCGGGCRVIAQAYPNNCDPLMKSGSEIRRGKLKPEPRKRIQIKDNYAPSKGVRFREENFGGVLMSRIGKEIIIESKSSIFIWKQIEKCIKVKDIIKNVGEKFKIDTKTAEKDVKTFLSILQSKGVIILI
jgi:radical SAM protein with 4Fe4S-binding SPASM domain